LINISWWLVFAPTIFWLVLYALAIMFVLKMMVKNSMTLEEFNSLIENKKK